MEPVSAYICLLKGLEIIFKSPSIDHENILFQKLELEKNRKHFMIFIKNYSWEGLNLLLQRIVDSNLGSNWPENRTITCRKILQVLKPVCEICHVR